MKRTFEIKWKDELGRDWLNKDNVLAFIKDHTEGNEFTITDVTEEESDLDSFLEDESSLGGLLEEFHPTRESYKPLSTEDLFNGKSLMIKDNVTFDEAPVIKICSEIMKRAVKMKANKLVIEPMSDRVSVMIKTEDDDIMSEMVSFQKELQGSVVARFKIMAMMNIVIRDRPQEGKIKISINFEDYAFYAKTEITEFGEKIKMKIKQEDCDYSIFTEDE
jgi:type II secretory ATPase GspE/PulE/Tfp pilus assembly ATPase PilB-like protein